jgi:CheY-like chemotaxis protein
MYILVVDDEADIRELMEIILKKSFPLNVVLAKSGNEAFDIISKIGKPEVIICDMNMQDGDGYFLFNKIRNEGWNIPFALCSTEIPNIEKNSQELLDLSKSPISLGL